MVVQGNYAYMGIGPRLVILDISDPALPILIGQTAVLTGIVNGVVVAGKYAYLAAWYHGFRIIDLSLASNPVEVGFYESNGFFPDDVAVSGNYAYVTSYNTGLRIIDVEHTNQPHRCGFLPY